MGTTALLLIVPLFFIAGCDSTATDTEHFTGVTWEWVESIDPYQGGTVSKPDSKSAGHTFLFRNDGSFVEDYPGGCCRYEGNWSLDQDTQVITLAYTDERQNGNRLDYQIRELTPYILRLGIQGRHGVVVETYQRAAEAGTKN